MTKLLYCGWLFGCCLIPVYKVTRGRNETGYKRPYEHEILRTLVGRYGTVGSAAFQTQTSGAD